MVITSENVVKVFEREFKRLRTWKTKADRRRRQNQLCAEIYVVIHQDAEYINPLLN